MIIMKWQLNLGSHYGEVFEGRNHQTLWQWVPMVTVFGRWFLNPTCHCAAYEAI